LLTAATLLASTLLAAALLLTAPLLLSTPALFLAISALFVAIAVLAATALLSATALLLSALLSRTGRLAWLVRITLCFHLAPFVFVLLTFDWSLRCSRLDVVFLKIALKGESGLKNFAAARRKQGIGGQS
jgi:hypothetical protein